MAFVLPNLSPPHALLQLPSKEKPIISIQSCLISSPLNFTNKPISSLTKLDSPPSQVGQINQAPQGDQKQQHDDFYVNIGLAVRTLREDMPLLFTKDLNYDIYRDDITFVDPLNKFTGIEKYKLIFWALRFHGKILFRDISLEIFRVWQPSENVILIRWNLRGVPRVPWEAKGEFQGTSRYKLDRNGKIYEHKVDNLAFNFPQHLKPAASVLDLVAASASPNPTFLWSPVDSYSSSWLHLYRDVRESLDNESSRVFG
ncbi:Eukaryotic translation initiation factor 4E transporter like [Heracleum sosnowskyi]|uniref:Eukaryotic translation initiation factor 4E transporter like n=1 Tax=Heracleum sosnowskyi TaxID=360622 RepID=A0AAD8J539_9APIA|nr:Eukaryotic translation initiation factor 4E transporter like [Heracleum sosnowskyi]